MAGESLTDLTAACIGEKTAAEARKHTDHVAVAAEATIDSLVETIVTIHKRRKENL
jgi:uroporphyrinogen-III synthase